MQECMYKPTCCDGKADNEAREECVQDCRYVKRDVKKAIPRGKVKMWKKCEY